LVDEWARLHGAELEATGDGFRPASHSKRSHRWIEENDELLAERDTSRASRRVRHPRDLQRWG
jgi:hypothetical protein